MTRMKFGFGQALSRVEDQRFITGAGNYATDYRADHELQCFILRAPYAHAQFTIRNVKTAREMPGVALVLTHEEVAHLGDLPCNSGVKNTDGSLIIAPSYPVLPKGRILHIGEAVVAVIAETIEQARDAAETIEIDYSPLPAAADLADARAKGAPLVHPGSPGNLAFETVLGNQAKTDKLFETAPRIVRLDMVNNRIVANYLETRSAVAEWRGDHLTVTLGSQGSHGLRDTLANDILRIPTDKVRVITPDVGGGFGTKTFMYREYPIVAEAARRAGRPVRWVSERTEHFFACAHGRDNLAGAEMALDEKGKFLALRVFLDANMGAFLSKYGPYIPYLGATMLTGCYRIPAGYTRIRGYYSHSVPVDAYRGAGRPEAAYTIERLVDFIADEIGMDRIALRKKNLIKPAEMPYRTPTRRVYDSGDFAGHMALAMERADWKGFPLRAKRAQKSGMLRGIGLGVYIEACGGGAAEPGHVRLEKDGSITVRIGTQSNGQGHETAYAQLASQHLDLPLSRIRVRQGDTADIPTGRGTGGSRSIPVGGVGVAMATEILANRLKDLASKALEASTADLEISNGRVGVVGTDRSIDFAAIAALPGATPALLNATAEFTPPEATYPNGTHVCEVEIDEATGETSIVNYVVVDDFGATLNPTLLAGQVHGGIAQGIGQALIENYVHDKSGQMLTASLLDYALPRADSMPHFHFETRNIPCITNPLGVKGAGEAGTIGAAPAVMNAVVDALKRARGIRHADMPATAHHLWTLLHKKA